MSKKGFIGLFSGVVASLLWQGALQAAPVASWAVGPLFQAAPAAGDRLCEGVQEAMTESLQTYPEMYIAEPYYVEQQAKALQLNTSAAAEAKGLQQLSKSLPVQQLYPLACSHQGGKLSLTLYRFQAPASLQSLMQLSGADTQWHSFKQQLLDKLTAELPAGVKRHRNWAEQVQPVASLPLFTEWLALDSEQSAAKAVERTQALLKQAPDYPEALVYQAIAYRVLEQYPEAEAVLQRLLKRFPQHPDALHQMAYLAAHQGNGEQARQYFQQLLKAYPYLTDKLYESARLDFELKNHKAAIATFEQLFALTPDHPQNAPNLRAIAYRELGQYQKALDEHSRLIAKYPTEAYLYQARANDYLAMGSCEKAKPDHEKACELRGSPCTLGCQLYDAGKVDQHFRQGLAYFDQGNYPGAVREFSTALVLDPKHINSMINRSSAYFSLGQYEAAFGDANDALKLDPNNVVALYNRGNAYAELGKRAEAMADYDKALSLDPKNSEVYYNRGYLFQELGEYAKALADYNAAIQHNPSYGAAYHNRALLYHASGETAKALQDIEKACELGIPQSCSLLKSLE